MSEPPHPPAAPDAPPSRAGSAAGHSALPRTSPALAARSPAVRPPGLCTAASAVSSAASAMSSAATTPLQTPRKECASLTPSPSVSKRSSFAENTSQRPQLRGRQQSVSGAALAELLMHPPHKHHGSDARFRGRDWRTIAIHEIGDAGEARFVELDTSIEDTTRLLVRSGAPNVVLVRESRATKTALATFDFSDLTAYLLLVLGLTQPDEAAARIADRARRGDVVQLRHVQDHLGPREEPVFLPHTASLAAAMQVLGTGHHRVVITKAGTTEAVGVLSQLRALRFFWDNHDNFAATEALYSVTLKELELGAKEVLAINGDRPVADALRLMHAEGITSLPVLDGHRNVVGNISHVDVRLLTDTSALPLLHSTCIHFIGVILSERGVVDGKDSYPVFHVTPFSTLAHTVAKLCATRSHRMWIVDAPSPNTSVPPSPSLKHSVPAFSLHTHSRADDGLQLPQHNTPVTTPVRSGGINENMAPALPYPSAAAGVSIGSGQLPGAAMSGRLSGVVSLTDILNLFARASGLKPGDPEETRRRRRQSSSSSIRPSMDSLRPSREDLARSVEPGRANSSASHSRERPAR